MRFESAKAIVKAAKDMGLEVRLHAGYSGRGMNGKTTHGVTGRTGQITKAIAAAAAELALSSSGRNVENAFTVEAFIRDVELAFDSMGLDVIAY